MSRRFRIPPSVPFSARSAALQALFHVEQGQPVQAALSFVLNGKSGSALPAQERNLCSDLVYGVLRYQYRLDFIVRFFLKKPDQSPLSLLLVLRMAVYSLLFQKKIPPHAAVHSAVSLATALCGKSMARVVNGVLRSVQRLGKAPYTQDFYAATSHMPEIALSYYYSLPLWLVQHWRAVYGEQDAERLMQRSLARPWTGLRFNPLHREGRILHEALCTALGVEQCVSVGKYGLAIAAGSLPEYLCGQPLKHWLDAGALSFQSAGSQAVLTALGCTDWKKSVWDACTGYGGKSAALLEGGVRCTLATDTSRQRLQHFPALCRRLGLVAPFVALGDARHPPLVSWQGHILADVPCTGLGVLAKRPDLRQRITPERSRQLQELQRQILGSLVSFLSHGSQLAYITCSLDPAENEQVVQEVLESRKDLILLTQWQTPHDHPWMEGMYGALLEKRPVRNHDANSSCSMPSFCKSCSRSA